MTFQVTQAPLGYTPLNPANNLSDVSSASSSRTNLGATTVGGNLFILANPSAVRFIQINADNTISVLDAATFRTAIGAQAAGSYQPLDATLTALAALTIAADSLTIGTGADAFSQTTFAANTFPAKASTGNLVAKTITDFALSLLTASTAVAARSTLGAGTGNGDALTSSTLAQFAATTSAQLAGIITDETGFTTGAVLVFSKSPTIDAPNITGHPTVEGVTSTGATGTGKFVFDTSPTLSSPIVGTQTQGDRSQKAASTEYVDTATDGRMIKYFCFSLLASPADSQNYLVSDIPDLTAATSARTSGFENSATIKKISFSLAQATNASNETVTIYLRNLTTSTDYLIGTFTSDFGANTMKRFNFTGLSIAVNGTDEWVPKIATPPWGTNPSNWRGSFSCY